LIYYSASRLESYRQCPQKYRFRYVDKIPSTLEGIEAFMGSRVHETLEWLYTNLRFCKSVSPETLIAFYHKKWDAEWHPDVQVVREEMSPDEYRALGERALREYDRRYRPFDASRTLGLEYSVEFPLDPEGQYVMKGYIDRLSAPEDGVIWIHDYKMRGFFPAQRDFEEDRQLAYYQMAVQRRWPETREIVLIWHYLIYNHEFRSHRTAEALEALRIETIALIDEIESATHFPTRQSALCDWCEYQSRCPLFRHLHETATLPKNEYENEAGVALVERMVRLTEAQAHNAKEMEKVKAALLAYAQRRGVETLFSTHHKVRVKVYDGWRFPGRNDLGRPALEKAVREAGKWDEVSSLDVFTLDKTLQKQAWDPEITARIRQFGEPQKNPWIKIFPRNERG